MSWIIEEQEDVRVLTMNSSKTNAMNPDFCRELTARLDELEASGPHPLVLTGTGSTYSAGLDLPLLSGMNRQELAGFFKLLDEALLKLYHYPAPVVAAVNGHAIAGGAVLALTCDSRVMARGSGNFGLREVQVGVSFPSVPFELTRAAIPRDQEREVLLFGTLFKSDEALKRGLVDEVAEADDLIASAARRAGRISADSLPAYAIVKSQINRVATERIAAHQQADDENFLDNWFSEAGQRRVAAIIAEFKKKKK